MIFEFTIIKNKCDLVRVFSKTITMTKAKSKTQNGAKRKKDTKDGNNKSAKVDHSSHWIHTTLKILVNENSWPKVDVYMSIYVPTSLVLSSGYPKQFTLPSFLPKTHTRQNL